MFVGFLRSSFVVLDLDLRRAVVFVQDSELGTAGARRQLHPRCLPSLLLCRNKRTLGFDILIHVDDVGQIDQRLEDSFRRRCPLS